jgi:hypothetical protein
MPHLHLPADHSDADIVLAASVAATVGSEDLYVAWTYESGAGVIPEVEAIMREPRPSIFVSAYRALRALLKGLTSTPSHTVTTRPAGAAPLREPSS